MTHCLLALGSNVGDRATILRNAVSMIAKLPACQLIGRSQWHETAPVGGPDGQGAFLNGALLLETHVAPQKLVTELLHIESVLGRERDVRWDARAIDIDLLLYGSVIIASQELIVPHPRMSFRRFVLEPAAEIAGEMVHPGSGWTIAGLLAHLNEAPCYVAIAAADPAVAGWLASKLAQELGCPKLEESLPNMAVKGASRGAGAIKSIEAAAGLLQPSHWQNEQVLSARLSRDPKCCAKEIMPVVSGFWQDALEVAGRRPAYPLDCLFGENSVRPALVIAVEPDRIEKFSQKICGKKFENNFEFPSVSPQEFCELLDRTGIGPLARIQSNDPGEVIQEAFAAVGSAW